MGSMFSKWQSKRKTLNVTAHIVQLKGKRDELEEHRNSLLRRMKQLETEIKNHVKQNERSQAMLCLRKRRLLAEHLSRIEQYLFQLLKVISDTEMAQVNLDVFKQLKVGAELLKTLSQRINIDEIEAIKAAEQEYRAEMDTLSQVMVQGTCSTDENELLRELDQLTQSDNPENARTDAVRSPSIAQDVSDVYNAPPETSNVGNHALARVAMPS